MATEFLARRKKLSKTRKLPFLPRVGVYIDVAGYEVVYKIVPFFETLANLVSEHLSPASLRRVRNQQLAEVQFPTPGVQDVLDTTHRTVSSRPR